jgi:hypothetical protein
MRAAELADEDEVVSERRRQALSPLVGESWRGGCMRDI